MTSQKAEEFIVSPAPHYHSGASTTKTMYTFAIALIPAVIFSICYFGMHSVRVIALAVASAMASEWIIQKLFKKPVTIYDGSALLVGLIFAMIIPPSVPWWLVVLGSFLSILIGKQIFGGIGYNPLNPVLVGWAILIISWKSYLNFDIAMVNYDLAYPILYPLSVLKQSGAQALSQFSYTDLFLGKQIGGIGASATLLILIGGIYLLIRGVVDWRIPVSFLGGMFLTALLFWSANPQTYADPVFHLITGNAMIGAFFLATEYSSSPVNKMSMIIYGLGCGIFTIIFRVWSIYPDGVVFAILIMNIMNPLIDKIRPKVPGKMEPIEEYI